MSNPTHIPLVDGLQSDDPRDVVVCLEAMTEIAKFEPRAIAPHAGALVKLLSLKGGKARWEAMHAIALISPLVPETIEALLTQLALIVKKDASVIMRDFAIDALAGYATTSEAAAKKALPHLQTALTLWDGKHAARTLTDLLALRAAQPKLAASLRKLAAPFAKHKRPGVRKAAAKLLA